MRESSEVVSGRGWPRGGSRSGHIPDDAPGHAPRRAAARGFPPARIGRTIVVRRATRPTHLRAGPDRAHHQWIGTQS
ncbi:hypothetical protein FRACA_1170012 [Frankia canadensis]|uniref:Uncharacterized protein n=1 Tax=Frankia canadensis TaxID=1836972 RepID=A0A2I2KJR6_9ACTN|nr:hypothetical protein FRACA_1170012 [Frankia canadensis]SOU53186.1 hypothetical protein FRACA_1170012 [Frankia canadensis]